MVDEHRDTRATPASSTQQTPSLHDATLAREKLSIDVIRVHEQPAVVELSSLKYLISDHDLTNLFQEPAHERATELLANSLLPYDVTALSPTAKEEFYKRCFHVPEQVTLEQVVKIILDHHGQDDFATHSPLSHRSLVSSLDVNYLRELRTEIFEELARTVEFKESLTTIDTHTKSLIERCRASDIKVVMCTGSGERVARAGLQAYGIDQLFDHTYSIFASDPRSGRGKPFPDPYNAVKTALQIPDSELRHTRALEDNFSGAMAAFRAGIPTILRPSGDFHKTVTQITEQIEAEGVPNIGGFRPTIDVVRCFSQVALA